MKQILKYSRLLAILPLALIALAPNIIGDSDAYKQEGVLEDTKEVFYFRGELTQATENNPYGGEASGDYFIRVNVNEVKVISNLDFSQFDGKVMQAWLVSFGGETVINLGTFEDNEFSVELQIDEWIYDVIIFSQVPYSFENPVGGDGLEKAVKHKSTKY